MEFMATGSDGQDRTAEIQAFKDMIGLDRIAPGRFSLLLLLGLFGGYRSGRQGPEKVMREIEALEGIGAPSQFKPPTIFRDPPLEGLWHKHYLQDGLPSMAQNLKQGLEQFGIPVMEKMIKETQESGEERVFEEEHLGQIVNDIVTGNWTRLAENQALTGEWIVFAKHEGKNYYLCLGFHNRSSHLQLRQQIDAICTQEFPFLSEILSKPDEPGTG